MRFVFIVLQLAKTLRRSAFLSAVAVVVLAVTSLRWSHAMYEWQDYRDGFRYYVSQASTDEMTADIDAQVQAIIDQCGIRIEFQAEKKDAAYREQKLGECKANLASYRRVAVTKSDDHVVVRAKVKCRCD